MEEKRVTYQSQNSYTTLNSYTKNTKNVWLVFHGMGYLSKFFITFFKGLNPEENYIIAPQAPSKYYQDFSFKHIGASWLTREDTANETKNVLNYVDEVAKAENISQAQNLIVLGFSQGVSIATRWLASRKLSCNTLVLHSGGIPEELKPDAFKHLPETSNVVFLYGNKDEHITEVRKDHEITKGNTLFGNRLQIEAFEGIHEVNTSFINALGKRLVNC
ncbi:MAG: esterase [Flavobacteriaceae bacterium]|nr:esterase [Flavobacteriaceae bacterium]